jgi:hypothetical protein
MVILMLGMLRLTAECDPVERCAPTRLDHDTCGLRLRLDERDGCFDVLGSLAMGWGKHAISWSRMDRAAGPGTPIGLYTGRRDGRPIDLPLAGGQETEWGKQGQLIMYLVGFGVASPGLSACAHAGLV